MKLKSLCIWHLGHSARRIALLSAAIVMAGACTRDPEVLKARYLERAEHYAQQGKHAEAVIEYRNAVQAAPQDGELRLRLAEAHSKNGDAANSAREYIRAADLLPGRADVQLTAGNLVLLAGRFDDAKVRAEKLLESAPQHVEGHVLLANALAGLKNFDQAITEIEEAIRLAPERGTAYTSLGAVEAGRGRSEAAERAFKKAVELDDRSAQTHLALANFYWVRKRWADAEEALTTALEVDPKNVLAHRALASLSIGLDRPADAEKHLKAVRDLTGRPEASLLLADFYIERKDFDSARNLLQPLVKAPATAAQANVRLAALDDAAGRREEALARIDSVLATEPKNVQALVAKSTMLLSEGRVDEALTSAQLAVQSDHNAAPAHFAVGRAQQARSQPDAAIAAYRETLRVNPRATGAHVAMATLHLKKGRSAEAVSAAEDALKTDPANPDARLALVRGLIARGDLQRAEPELKRLTTEYPASAAIRVQNGILLGRRKDFTGARREFEQAIAFEPQSAEALAGLVALDLAEKRPDAAKARVKPYADGVNASAAVLMVAAQAYGATGDLPTSERLLRRIVERQPDYLPAYGALGRLYVRQGRQDAAVAEFDAAAARDSEPVGALTAAAMILQGQGKTAEARQRYERALQVDPTAPVAANNLAWMHAESGGNLDIALQLAQTAYRKLPDNAEVADTLGFIYYKKGLLSQAVAMLRTTVEKNGGNPLFQYHLGLALAESGDAAGAKEHLTLALKLNPDFEGASDARNLLATLTSR